MIIDNLAKEQIGAGTRVSAQITWEDSSRPPQSLYFETPNQFARLIKGNPHSFLVACAIPAMRFGEKRIYIDEEICPDLLTGLTTAMRIVRHWSDHYPIDMEIVNIESDRQKHAPVIPPTKTAAFLFSGGIDSLATLLLNRLNFNEEHSLFIRDGLLIRGLEVKEAKPFDHVLKRVSALAKDASVDVIPINTNIRDLGPEKNKIFWGDFWIHEFMGATFAAVGHALADRIHALSINSCHDIPNLMPYGSHPLLNPLFSSHDLKIRHEGYHLSRFEKTKLVSTWGLALRHLRVCNHPEYYNDEVLNCGKCEKCVRTMIALEAVDALGKATAFPVSKVTPELIEQSVHLAPNTLPLYKELIPPLKKSNRNDLIRAIERKFDEFHRDQIKSKWKKHTVDPIIEFDKKYLNGFTKKMVKRVIH